MSDANYTKRGNTSVDPEIKFILKLLESLSEYRPYFDPDFRILVLEESETPIMIMSSKVFKDIERKIIGDV